MATGTFDIIHPGHGYYLEESKKIGGKQCSSLVVVVARDATVDQGREFLLLTKNRGLEVVKMLKPVDEAYLGSENDMFKVVEQIKPDIITLGSDQKYNLSDLKTNF